MVFQCINIRQVPWEVLKTAAFGLGFQHLPRDLANVNVWKTMFDPFNNSYYFYFIPLLTALAINGIVQISMYLQTLDGCSQDVDLWNHLVDIELTNKTDIGVAPIEKVSSVISGQRRPRSACESAQSE